MSLLSLCLKKIFCLPPTPSACSHSPYIFRAENTWGEKVTMCVLFLRHKNIRTCFFVCRVVYFSSSARRDRGGGRSPEGLKSCVSKPTPTHCVDSPYIFRSENTEGEKITVRDMKIAPTEIFCGAMLALKGIFFTTTPPWQLHRY